MPVCDVCNRDVAKGEGFLLTTDQVVRTPRYWEYAFNHEWSYYGQIDPEGRSLALTVRKQVGQDSAWLICEEQIDLFDIDKAQLRSHCGQWWSTGQRYSPPGTGPGSFPKAVEAATASWEKVFGKRPTGVDEGLPLAASLHTFDRRGITPTVVMPHRRSPASSTVAWGGAQKKWRKIWMRLIHWLRPDNKTGVGRRDRKKPASGTPAANPSAASAAVRTETPRSVLPPRRRRQPRRQPRRRQPEEGSQEGGSEEGGPEEGSQEGGPEEGGQEGGSEEGSAKEESHQEEIVS